MSVEDTTDYLPSERRKVGVNTEDRMYATILLNEVDEILSNCPEDHKAFFILYYGLNEEHGRWTALSIANHYNVDRGYVLNVIKSIRESLPSERHRTFVRKFFELG
jgi:hypothetical protein